MNTLIDEGYPRGALNYWLSSFTAGMSDALIDAVVERFAGLIDRRPVVIAQCTTTADIAAAVRFATSANLEIAVRGGGHNVAGRCVVDDGMMIDLSRMRAVEVDPEKRTARVEGGALWSDVNEATAEHGLAVTGGAISSTGVGGYTLGGGLGWLMSTQGLACDNLQAVELVSATGEVLQVDDTRHPDLMWALRGGGGNFGIAASLTFRLRPQPMVYGGLIAHPIDAGEIGAPDPSGACTRAANVVNSSGLAGMIVCHTDPDRAEADLAPLWMRRALS
jgi:FAD/FMN-containing dehydrogenase